MEKKTIGQFIAILRKANGLTQQELADKLNVSNKAVSRWERDESAPDITLIPALAELLGVTCDELLKGERIAYTQQPEKKEAKVEKQVRALIQREISKYRTLMLIAVAVALAGPIVMLVLVNTVYWIYDACFAVMLLFEVIAFVIETIAVTKMRDAKADSEVFECADETLIHKYNKCLGDFSFWVYFLIIASISGIYINNPNVFYVPEISAFFFWILLCVGMYLFIKKPYVRWITGDSRSLEEDTNARPTEVEIRLKKMNRIQIGAILLSGVVYIVAPYFERSPEDALILWIVFVSAIGLVLVNVITAVVFIAKEKGNRKQFALSGIRNICLLPCCDFLVNVHNMGWIYETGEKYDTWYVEYLIYAACWAVGVTVIFKLIERLIRKK